MHPDSVSYIVLHSSGTGRRQHVDKTFLDRRDRANGFLKIGYHFVIKRNGEVEVGRPLTERCGHLRGLPHQVVSICLAGGRAHSDGPVEDNFTLDQLAAAGKLVFDLRHKFRNAETVSARTILGPHADGPLFNVSEWLKETGIANTDE